MFRPVIRILENAEKNDGRIVIYLLVYDMGYDCSYTLGAFSSKELALQHKDMLIKSRHEEDELGSYVIEEYELDIGLYPYSDRRTLY